MIDKRRLEKLYNEDKKSMQEIAALLGCSVNRIVYWMRKHGIARRSISEAVYARVNPNGDPFKLRAPRNMEEAKLLGLGIGLYWGEGTKASKNAVRLGNSDPALMRKFMEFLQVLCGVAKQDFKFELQIYSDVDKKAVEQLWIKALDIKEKQLYKTRVTERRGNGSYRRKNQYGVMTIYYGNTKLRNKLVGLLPR
ncbi:MAG: hypothetical protein Q8P99_00465 [bacterium]|nr:hypothetical protein [bacterium]MDZ4231484.1 hypothetical protein [Patescibacteria group bacterium]